MMLGNSVMPIPFILYGAVIATNFVFTNATEEFYREIDRLRLPVQYPFERESLTRFTYDTNAQEYTLQLKTGWQFYSSMSRIIWFESPDHKPHLQVSKSKNKKLIPLAQALEIARAFIGRTGMTTNEAWIYLEPKIQEPDQYTPYYEFDWSEPNKDDAATVSIAVDSQNGAVIYANLPSLLRKLLASSQSNQSLWLHQPGLQTAMSLPSAEIEQNLVAIMVNDLARFSDSLPIVARLENVAAMRRHIVTWRKISDRHIPEYWTTVVECDGWKLGFRAGKLVAWTAEDAFFESERPPELNRVVGEWRLSEKQAIEMVRNMVGQLSLPPNSLNLLAKKPEVLKPNVQGKLSIPRFLFEWQETKSSSATGFRYVSGHLTAEVDAQQGKIKRLSVYFWEEGDKQVLVK